MFCTEFEVFRLSFSLFENEVRVLVWNFEKIFIGLKGQIPIAINSEKIFEAVKTNFHIFWNNIQKLYFITQEKAWLDYINLLISFE